MLDSDRRRLGLMGLVFWTMVAAAASTIGELDWTQDLGAYAVNIEHAYYLTEQLRDDKKIFWYEFIVIPLADMSPNVESTIVALKCLTASVFFLSMRKLISNSLDAGMVVALIVFAPVMSENLHEYLRQGMGIATLLFAVSCSSRLVRWPLVGLAVMQHTVVAPLAVCIVAGEFLGRRAFEREGKVNRALLSLGIVAVATAGVLSMAGGPVLKALPLGALGEYLGGDRGNVLGALYLLTYALYLGWRSLHNRSAPHVVPYLGMVAVCATYLVTVDFGRTVSLVMPLHIAAATTLSRQRDRLADLLVPWLAGVALWFA